MQILSANKKTSSLRNNKKSKFECQQNACKISDAKDASAETRCAALAPLTSCIYIYISINLSCLRQMFRSGPLKGGLQEKMYFLLGCVRCASGKYDLIDRECDFQRKLFKNQILHDIFMENSKRYEKWGQDTAKVRKWIPGWAKVKERAPKVSQGTP